LISHKQYCDAINRQRLLVRSGVIRTQNQLKLNNL
jgi:hypothetical protein